MFKLIVIYSTFCSLWITVQGLPQDLQTGVLIAAAQVKDTFDNGAAARFDKSIEVLGSKWTNDMEIGFGDAMKQRRSISDSDSSSSSSSESSDNKRRRRSVNLLDIADDLKAIYNNL